jgi:hypothetical protein
LITKIRQQRVHTSGWVASLFVFGPQKQRIGATQQLAAINIAYICVTAGTGALIKINRSSRSLRYD